MADFTDYAAAVGAVSAAVVAYVAVLRNSQPLIAVYYRPSQTQSSLIDLVVENNGTATAYDVTFSKPIPVGWFGIEGPDSRPGKYIPTDPIGSLMPGQQFIYLGGQFAGLNKQLGKGLTLKVSYRYNPPLWCNVLGSDECVLSVAHLAWAKSNKSMEEAVTNAMTGLNNSTIKSISTSLQGIERELIRLGQASNSPQLPPKPFTREDFRKLMESD